MDLTPPTLLQEAGIWAEGLDGIWIALFQQDPAPLVGPARQARIASPSNGLASLLACGKERIDVCALHDEVEQIALAPDMICLRPTSPFRTHDCLFAQDLMGSNSLRCERKPQRPAWECAPWPQHWSAGWPRQAGRHQSFHRKAPHIRVWKLGWRPPDAPMDTGGEGLRFGGIVHHTDAEREYAYDRSSSVGKLDKALDAAQENGWSVVDMKQEWNRVFAFDQ